MISILTCVILYFLLGIFIIKKYNRNSKGKDTHKTKMYINLIIFIAIFIYIAMIMDTHSLMTEVKNVFKGNVSMDDTKGLPIDRYNIRDNYKSGGREEKVDLNNVELTLIRVFTIHNFTNGYVWAFYSCKAYDTRGELLQGSTNIFTRWKIHRENGKWTIIEIFEAP